MSHLKLWPLFSQHRSTPSDGSGQHVKTDPDKHDASRSSQGETEKEDPTNAKPVFKELSLDDLVAPPGYGATYYTARGMTHCDSGRLVSWMIPN